MKPVWRRLCVPLGGLALILTVGCHGRPTYPKAHLTEAFQTLLAEERLHASVRFVDHTLAVQLEQPDALAQSGGQIGIGPAFDEATRKTLTVIHRVLLSTDAEVRFYVLLMSDPNVPGAYLTVVRYLDDVRRANVQMLDTPEMFARTIFELNFVGANVLTLEQYVPRDIRLEEFLSWQLARRIQHQLTEELQQDGLVNVGRCGGQFDNGEFAFTLDVSPSTAGSLDESTIQRVFRTATNLIAKVLSNYRFEDFESVRLTHPLTGRTLLLPKTRLEVFR
ncbi:MAG: hypothetical protein HYY59_00665 [Candidatus Omnitrophica bacterium]|nr:hypothetical protein [Candidatus Omnitrophota bacterium]MBI2495646.1 hypothetical protein [Candidatus Omnitrophota bacterium]MBI3020503.1 hypothetical protein [Candidatus Omnitrophota bacterium]